MPPPNLLLTRRVLERGGSLSQIARYSLSLRGRLTLLAIILFRGSGRGAKKGFIDQKDEPETFHRSSQALHGLLGQVLHHLPLFIHASQRGLLKLLDENLTCLCESLVEVRIRKVLFHL